MLRRFLGLYAALFAAFGVASPFVPGLLQERGLGPNEIATVLALGTAIRLLTGPAGARLADRSGRAATVLAGFLALSATVALGYALPGGFVLLLGVGVLHAAVLAPLTPIADALSLAGSAEGGFAYGWVRGAGSAAFVVGAGLSGQVVARAGLGSVVWLNAGLLAAAAMAATFVPRPPAPARRAAAPGLGAARALLRLPHFAALMGVAALVEGSHALHDGFEVIRWRAAGIGPGTAGLLWSEAVLAEVAVFAVLGPALLRRLDTRQATALAALAGMVRWGVTARTAWLPAMALVQPLHGLTFALTHLACMRLINQVVPPSLAATAQAFYGTVAVGAATAALTLACGPLYDRFGAGAFWVMAALCAAALPLAWTLRDHTEAARPSG